MIRYLVASISCFATILCIGCNQAKVKPDSPKIYYYDNGDIKAIKHFRDTVLNGSCFWFYPNGKIEQSLTYILGQVEGHAYFYYESGALKSRKVYKNNKPVGYAEDYFDHSIGMLRGIIRYNDSGQVVYKKQFDSSGNVTSVEGRY